MNKWTSAVGRLVRRETAVSSIEYALLASLVAMLCVATIGALGGNLDVLYLKVCNAFPGASC